MRLQDQLTAHGNFLFRWRNYTPLFLLPLFFIAAPESARMETMCDDINPHIWTYLCMCFSAIGIVIRSVAIGYSAPGTSGRNRHGQVADSLNTTGVYSVVRHPLYLGNYIGLLGLMISTMVWWLAVIGTLIYWIVIERIIMTEEAFLSSKFGENYNNWTSTTPAFFPNLSKWHPPMNYFSWREILKREYNGVAALAASFLFLSAILEIYGKGLAPSAWVREYSTLFIIFFLSLILLIILRTLRKHTSVLSEVRHN